MDGPISPRAHVRRPAAEQPDRAAVAGKDRSAPRAEFEPRSDASPGRESLVLMIGAGVSMAEPSSVPGWSELAAAVAAALGQRLAAAVERWTWLDAALARLDTQRSHGRLPPEYQAQLIEEMAGLRYFEGLQSLDVSIGNPNHRAIARLVEMGLVRAIVTTNFDRLIEQALERRGIPFEAVYSEDGFRRLANDLASASALPIIKIHGCVQSAASMVDTLKQRRRGRSRDLRACLDALAPGSWIFAGFSAADLQSEPDYLGFLSRAASDSAAVYLRHAESIPLTAGAERLMAAYGPRARVEASDLAAYLSREFAVPCDPADEGGGPVSTGGAQFREKLAGWANGLSPSAAGLCLAALFEASGDAETAAWVLDRLARKDVPQSDRDSDDYRAVQLHYGRIGAAGGRYIAVPDLQGQASNASFESVQSLLRLQGTRFASSAEIWLAPALLWLGYGRSALTQTVKLLTIADNPPEDARAEEVVDGWVAAAQVCVVDASAASIGAVCGMAGRALETARACGDVVRAGRVAALHMLAAAETEQDLLAMRSGYQTLFTDVDRVHDGFTLGIRNLALGRWRVGMGGAALRAGRRGPEVAVMALEDLELAHSAFEEQVLDPWMTLTYIQQAKAWCDLSRLEEVERCTAAAGALTDRFQVLRPHLFEAVGSIRLAVGDSRADESFAAGAQAAHECGLPGREEHLRNYLKLAQ